VPRSAAIDRTHLMPPLDRACDGRGMPAKKRAVVRGRGRAAAEPIVVDGVVASTTGNGVGGRWKAVVELAPWRRRGGEVVAEPLSVFIPVSDRELWRLRDRLDRGDGVRVTVTRLRPRRENPGWFADGRLPVRKVAGDAELRRARAGRDRPVVVRDEVLGRLVLDRELGWFEGKARLDGRRCDLFVSQSAEGDDRARAVRDVERARAAVARVERALPKIHAAIAKKMLPLYDEVWREGRPRLTRERFLARLRPLSIATYTDGDADVMFGAGNTFYDHAIGARVTRRGSIAEVVLQG